MTEKITWNTHVHCIVVVVNDTTMRVPRILNAGGCMRPPQQLLVINKMFGYQQFDVICRRKYRTIEVIDMIKASPLHPGGAGGYVALRENKKLFTTLIQKDSGGYRVALP